MQRLLKRVTALEVRKPQAFRWVWRNRGESDTQAVERAGIEPDASVLIFSWKD